MKKIKKVLKAIGNLITQTFDMVFIVIADILGNIL